MSKKENTIIVVLIVITAVISLSNLNSINNFENSMMNMQSKMDSMQNHLTQEISQISGTVKQINEDSRWWSPGDYEITKAGQEHEVMINWFLREYREGSKVSLNYRKAGDSSFKSMDAVKDTSGHYYAVFNVEAEPEPVWNNYFSKRISADSDSGSNIKQELVEEKYHDFNNDYSYEYFISVIKDDITRSTEIRNININQISHTLFNPIHSNVHIMEDNSIEVKLFVDELPEAPRYQIEDIWLVTRKGDSESERWRLEKEAKINGQERAYSIKIIPKNDYTTLFIVINYNDDLTIERQIDRL